MNGPQPSSVIELKRKALKQNLGFVRRWIGRKALLSSVVKGNAYGHGIDVFVPLAEELGVDHFAVFDAHEAWRVFQCLGRHDSRVMIMGMIADHDLDWVVSEGVEFFVFDCTRLRQAIDRARSLRKPARVHLEVETGLNRTGFSEDGLREAVRLIGAASDAVEVVGVCTHLAGAESFANHDRIRDQIARFRRRGMLLEEAGVRPRFRHAACSAAAITYPETILDMVRVGILQYGYWPSEETRIHYLRTIGDLSQRPLKRIIRWSTRVLAVRRVAAGDRVGYGNAFVAPRDMALAVLPVGYAWGYSRALSNRGRVLIHGKRANVVGLVNMNHVIVDVTGFPAVEAGDEAVLIGTQKKASIPVSAFTELSNQLNYELLTRLPRDIPRVVVS